MIARGYQVNNLRVRFARRAWQVLAPGGRILAEFDHPQNADDWAENTWRYLTRAGRKRKYGK